MTSIADRVASGKIEIEGQLHRSIDWTGAFWVASGVPALVLFSIGGIAGTTGKLAFLIWTVSIVLGFVQSFTYAEIAGLFPNKSGGASIYGAAAWVRYSKLVAPLSVWCNWFAWSPVLALGCSIAAAYILNALAPVPLANGPEVAQWLAAHGASIAGSDADKAAAAVAALTPALRSWTAFSHSIGPVSFSFNAAFFVGAILMLLVFAIQHRGILGTANVQKWIGLSVIIPMVIVGVVPLITGKVDWSNFSPLVPLAAASAPEPGSWNIAGWTLILGGMFIAAWSTYAFETAVCYTSEFRNPSKDTFKAIFYSGLLCMALFILVPFTFQGVLGLTESDPAIVDGSGVAQAMAHMVGGGQFIESVLVMLMILALILSIMTAMAGSSRTLYQGSVDGWLPRYLSHVNSHGAPTRAMWTDLTFNLILLAIACADATSSSSSSRFRTAAISFSTSSISIPAGSTGLILATSHGPTARPPGSSASAPSSPSSTSHSWAPALKFGTLQRSGLASERPRSLSRSSCSDTMSRTEASSRTRHSKTFKSATDPRWWRRRRAFCPI